MRAQIVGIVVDNHSHCLFSSRRFSAEHPFVSSRWFCARGYPAMRNCQCMIQFYEEYNQELTLPKSGTPIAQLPVAQLGEAKTQPTVAQLPEYNFTLPVIHLSWTHNIILIQRVKDIQARYWYMIQSIANHWSKDFLIDAIKLDFYKKHGALANNFDIVLPQPEAAEVKSMLKDPYVFDMLTFTERFDEGDIELGLVKEIEKFLLEMGRASLSWDDNTIWMYVAMIIILTY